MFLTCELPSAIEMKLQYTQKMNCVYRRNDMDKVNIEILLKIIHMAMLVK